MPIPYQQLAAQRADQKLTSPITYRANGIQHVIRRPTVSEVDDQVAHNFALPDGNDSCIDAMPDGWSGVDTAAKHADNSETGSAQRPLRWQFGMPVHLQKQLELDMERHVDAHRHAGVPYKPFPHKSRKVSALQDRRKNESPAPGSGAPQLRSSFRGMIEQAQLVLQPPKSPPFRLNKTTSKHQQQRQQRPLHYEFGMPVHLQKQLENRLEQLQVIRYEPGQFYHQHTDYFEYWKYPPRSEARRGIFKLTKKGQANRDQDLRAGKLCGILIRPIWFVSSLRNSNIGI